MTASGMSALVRCTCSATGRTFSCANRWKVSRTSSKSSDRWAGPVPWRGGCPARCSRDSGGGGSAAKGGGPGGGGCPGRLLEDLGRAVLADEVVRPRQAGGVRPPQLVAGHEPGRQIGD